MFVQNKSAFAKFVLTALMAVTLALGLTPFASAQSDNVKKVQESLRDKGYDPGPVDGVMGSKTRHALGEYQKSEDLPVTHHVDAKTAEKMGVEQESAGGKFKAAGHNVGEGGEELGHDVKKGRPIEAGKDFGKGVGRAGKDVGEGVKKAVTP